MVLDQAGYALYFNRATIPWARDAFAADLRMIPPQAQFYRHNGLYAYRVSILRQYPSLQPAPIGRFEALEQLRVLWYGYRIAVRIVRGAPAPDVYAGGLGRVHNLFAQGGV